MEAVFEAIEMVWLYAWGSPPLLNTLFLMVSLSALVNRRIVK